MIQWTVPGSVPDITGSSTSSSSSASSASYSTSVSFTDAANSNSVSASASSSGSTAASGETIVDGVGATTRTFSSFSSTYTREDGLTADPKPEIEPTGGTVTITDNADGSSSSTVTSGETTTVFTAQARTSATSTYESGYEAYSYLGTVAADLDFDPLTAWTSSTKTYNSDNTDLTTVEFNETTVSTITSYTIEFSTREGTSTYTEFLDQTVTLSGLPDTIIQAAPDEIIYVIQEVPSSWNGYSAATALADSGTRFTLSPSIKTIERPAMAATAPTSTAEFRDSFSAGVTYSVVSASQVTITSASYFSFPPQTGTRTTNSYSLRSSSNGVSLNSASTLIGSGVTTIATTDYTIIPATVRRQTQTQTYAGLTDTTSSFQSSAIIEAAVTLETEFATEDTFRILLDVADFTGPNGNSSGSTSYAEGNTTISTPRAALGIGSLFGRTKYRTTGAVVGSQTGGWITANATSQGFNFGIYAIDGSGRNGQTVFPQTNAQNTVQSNFITWTTSTAALSGGGTQSTTTSAQFGVSGQPTITTDARPLSIFGGTPGFGCTIVERPAAGVYKNRIGGGTSTFSQGDISFTSGVSQSVRAWFPIRHIGPLQLGANLNPITWAENRNNSQSLPPNTPFAF